MMYSKSYLDNFTYDKLQKRIEIFSHKDFSDISPYNIYFRTPTENIS